MSNNVCKEGNRLAQSKHHLLSTWPQPNLVRDIAKFISFVQFYSMYIHHFKLWISPLSKLTINHDINPIWTDAAQEVLSNFKGVILSNPCLIIFNHKRRVVIRTNFSSKGFGYVVCQPGTGTGAAFEQAMAAYRAGKDFAFMTKESSAVLRLVAFGG